MSAIFGEYLTFRQEQGPDVELVVFGDEFYARYETVSGYTVIYDGSRGLYCYADLLNGQFISTGIPLSKEPPAGLRRHLKESPDVRNQKFSLRHAALRPVEADAAAIRMRTIGPNRGLLEGRRVSEGPVLGLTVLVEFADLQSSITAADVQAMLNGPNYSANGNFCSVRDYFHLISGGKLDYTNAVMGPIRLSRPQAYYKNQLFVREAMDLVAAQLGNDFARFDSRGEGMIDAISFMYAGRTLYEGELWPHNAVLQLRYGNYRTHFYMLTSMGRDRVDLSIGTFCHESGHLLCRFPDLYDYGERDGDFEQSEGMGVYCLMGSGNHLDRGRTPSPVCGYLRDLVGWADNQILLNNPGDYACEHGNYASLVKYETNRPNEYFILENRSQMGLDTHLPSGGLAVYHCDWLGSNEWQGGTADRHYQCGLLQADGHLDLERNRNSGDAGDLFGARSGAALAHDTMPSSRQWDGADSGLTLGDIGAPGGRISFRVGARVPGDVVRTETTADMLIPDNQPAGIRSVTAVATGGRVKSIQLRTSITHTYIGDLQVELVSPSGKTARVHDRSGGGTDDLKATWNSASNAALAALAGESMAGNWTLAVRDVELRDTGRLNWWGMEIAYEAMGGRAGGSADPALAIPDANTQGVQSAIAIQQSGQLSDIQVTVAIRHTYRGDLLVEVVAPSGHSAVLHNRTGGSADDLRATFDPTTTPALAALMGEGIKGDWILRVRDLASVDTGTLEAWSLQLRY